MKTYIYIDWDNQKCYTSWDEVIAAYRENLVDDDFNEFLLNSYPHEEIFNLSEERRAEILKEYNDCVNADAKYWACDCLESIEIKIEMKGE